MKKLAVVVTVALTLAWLVLPQAASAQAVRPGPEHQRLGVLVGNWTTEGTCDESPFGPADKWSSTISSEWFPGQFAVVRHVDGRSSTSGDIHELDVFAYDAVGKAYSWYVMDNLGFTGLSKVVIEGDVLTSMLEVQAQSRTYKVRGTLKGLGGDKLTWLQEYSEDGKTWKPYCRATDKRGK